MVFPVTRMRRYRKNSKIRDIQASVNSFFNSVSTQFNLAGYNKDIGFIGDLSK